MEFKKTMSLIATVLGLSNHYLKTRLKELGLGDLAPSHGSIVLALLSNGRMSMKDLASLIRRDKSTLTALVGKLEKQGYVRKRPSAEDCRVVFVDLGEKGQSLKEPFAHISEDLHKTALRNLSDDEIRQLHAILGKVAANFSFIKGDGSCCPQEQSARF